MRRGAVLLIGTFLALGLTSCSQPGDGGYRLTAYFPKAVALYAQSRVKVMGLDVGRVTSVGIDGDQIRFIVHRGSPALSVIPAKAGTQGRRVLRLTPWTPAFAGATTIC